MIYAPLDLTPYYGQDFCLRITVDRTELDDCFFVYLPQSMELLSLEEFFRDYFIDVDEEKYRSIEARLNSKYDPDLRNKYRSLVERFGRCKSGQLRVFYHINHGPSPPDLADTIRRHLSISIWDNGEPDNKLLDVVLEFKEIATVDEVFSSVAPELRHSLLLFFREIIIVQHLSKNLICLSLDLVANSPTAFREAVDGLEEKNIIFNNGTAYQITDQGYRHIAAMNHDAEFFERFTFLRHTHFDDRGNVKFLKRGGTDLRVRAYQALFGPVMSFHIVFMLELVTQTWDKIVDLPNTISSDDFFCSEFAYFSKIPKLSESETNALICAIQERLKGIISF